GLIGFWFELHALALFLGWGSWSWYFASWARKNPIVRLSQDHIEVKAAPLAPLRLVRYGDIERLDIVSPTKANLWIKGGAVQRLPIVALEPEQRTALTAAIDAK